MKRLIVNADDFGLSPEVNAGIMRAHRDGILRCASLMVAEPSARAAAELARDNPALDVGLHAVVCRGRSMLTASRLGAAVSASGEFMDSPVAAGMRYFFDRSMRAAMTDELRAQVERQRSVMMQPSLEGRDFAGEGVKEKNQSPDLILTFLKRA